MFVSKIKALAQRVHSVLPHLETEEATKTALVMPFIAALGYDVFDPSEVIPEFTADVGIKRGEKVDYAIKRDGEIIILIEAKKARADLNAAHSSQLFRYFTVTKARIAILTNGIRYRFFSDLEENNKMDAKPFLELNLLELRDNVISELGGMTKEAFNLEDMLVAAAEMKSLRDIRGLLEKQFDDPDEDFARFFFSHSSPSRKFVQSARDHFIPLVKKALHQAVSDRVQDRLRMMMQQADVQAQEETRLQDEPVEAEAEEVQKGSDDGIVTTEEELRGYAIVRAIIGTIASPERVTYRDTQSYCNVLFDDNVRKPICRLHLNRTKKYLGVFGAEKRQERILIGDVEEIMKYADHLLETVKRYMGNAQVKG